MQEEIRELVGIVWETMLGGRPAALDEAQSTAIVDPIRARIEISGGWSGALTLELSGSDAARAASILLETKPGEIEPEEVLDAVGELTNIIGGNLKAILPEPLRLGLPCTTEGPESGDGSEPREEARFEFEWEGSPFAVVLTMPHAEPEGPA